MLKKSLPTPALRAMNAPFTIGLPAVPWIVVTPDAMLKGRAEYACSSPLSWKPWLISCHTVVAGAMEECTAPFMTRRCRWSSSERPQSFERSNGSIGELKKNSPTLFIDFDSVYEILKSPHRDGRCMNETCSPW